MLPTLLLAFLAGPVATTLGDRVDQGGAPLSIFGFLLISVSLLVQTAGRQAQVLALEAAGRRLWLLRGVKRSQKLILPFGTAGVISTGLSCLMTAGFVLLASTPGWSALNVFSLGFAGLGGLLVGFGLSRLLVGVAIVSRSSQAGPRRRAWRLGAVAVALGSVANAAYSVHLVLGVAPGI